ncbi:MAG: hypothetical protein H6747_10875 [Deltaproteobacteria bacterium]|nr:hypothetical protein [Deltaproteobacteria bacterium]
MSTPALAIRVPVSGDALRSALLAAPPGATLRLGGGVYQGPFVLMQDVTLVAADPEQPPTLRGAGEGALLPVDGKGVRITLRHLQLEDGGDTNAGGLVRVANGARLLLEDCVLRRGQATGYGGGGLYLRRGEATLRRCRIEACEGRNGGGVLIANDATLLAEACVFAGNVAHHGGAAICVRDRAVVRLLRCDLHDHERPAGASGTTWLIEPATGAGAQRVASEGCRMPS